MDLIINITISIIGFYLLINSKKKMSLKIDVKAEFYSLVSIPLTALFFLKNSTLYVLITIFILQINEVNHKTSLSGKILTKCLINNSKRLAIFWPFLFIISIITTLLFGEYKEQEIISKLKNLETTEELIRIIISALIFAPLLEEIFFQENNIQCL
jgi:membrane protease YdiL (CAAX protease family)